jgi:hypothetical protein
MARPVSLATALLAAALLLPGQFSVAQDAPTYRAGLKSFTIPAPSPNLIEAGADYRVLLEPFAPTANRLIAAFVEPSDLESIRSGGTAPLNLYALVEIPRRAEFANVTSDQYKEVAASIATQFGTTFDASLKDQQDEINRRLKALGSTAMEVTLDKPVQLGTFFSKQDACSYGVIMALSSGGKVRKMVMGIIVLRLQSRVLFVYTYSAYKDETSIQWIRTTDERWADAILQANQ